MLREISQTQKDKYHMIFSHVENIDFLKELKVEGDYFREGVANMGG
jgi:hypothetical protein